MTAPTRRSRLGEILVASGALSEQQLEHALAQQPNLRLPLGKGLLKLNYVTDEIMRRIERDIDLEDARLEI